jgi:hypothetical protein
MTTVIVPAAWWVGEAIKDSETEVFAVTAGLGAGKTHGEVQWHHLLSTEFNREAKYSAFLEPTFQKIHDAAIPTFRKVLAQCGYTEGRDFRVIKSPYPKLIYIETGHEVHFLSADAPNKIIAAEYSHASEDESGIITREASDNLRSRIRAPGGTRWQMFKSGAPQGLNDFSDVFDSETLPGWDLSELKDHRHRERKFRRFTVWTDDNPHIRPGYIELLQDTYGHSAALIQSYRFGRFVPFTSGLAASNYAPQRHVVTDIAGDPALGIDLTWDFNANSRLAWAALQNFTFEEYGERISRYLVVDEANEGHSHLDEAVLEFSRKFPVTYFRDTPIALMGDSSGNAKSHKTPGSDYDNIKRYLKDLGYRRVEIMAAASNPLETESVEALNRAFAKNLVFVCRRCVKIQRSLSSTTWKEGTRKLDKPAEDDWTDHFDALKYHAFARLKNFTGRAGKKVYGLNQ